MKKVIEKRKRKQDNIKLQRDQKRFFKTLEVDQTRERKMPEIEKFVKFWGGIWKKNKRTPNIEEVQRLLDEKFTVINEFGINTEKLTNEIQQKKGPDGSRNGWSTKLLVEKAKSGPKRFAECIQKDNL